MCCSSCTQSPHYYFVILVCRKVARKWLQIENLPADACYVSVWDRFRSAKRVKTCQNYSYGMPTLFNFLCLRQAPPCSLWQIDCGLRLSIDIDNKINLISTESRSKLLGKWSKLSPFLHPIWAHASDCSDEGLAIPWTKRDSPSMISLSKASRHFSQTAVTQEKDGKMLILGYSCVLLGCSSTKRRTYSSKAQSHPITTAEAVASSFSCVCGSS